MIMEARHEHGEGPTVRHEHGTFSFKLPQRARLLHAAAFLIVSSRRVASVVIMASEMRYVDGMPPGRPWVIRGDVVHLVFRF